MKTRTMGNGAERCCADFEVAAPRADAMIQSLRAFGYDLATAVADLIDNSISAGAKNIRVVFHWSGADSSFSLIDDGRGMSEADLFEAMRPGTRSPLESRDPRDLGRFGLGLKTASFSQCRRLTVRSKRNDGGPATRCWDLDYVTRCGEWRLLKSCSASSERFLSELDSLESGTVVLWEIMDRLVADTYVDDAHSHNRFLERVEQVHKHIAMVFHRFLERPNGIKVWVNDQPVKPWDPFLSREKATQCLTDEVMPLFGKSMNVRPYVLPHHSKISSDMHINAAGPRGWNAQQGFYVYRNDRLLVDGDWLGLGFQKEEHYKLARISIDIPNSLDSEWKIDVKKSIARPPAQLRERLKRIARLTRDSASAVYRHRGQLTTRHALPQCFVWEERVRHGKRFYCVNREHPLVKDALIESESKPKLRALLTLLEETVPVPMIAISNAENPDRQGVPFEHLPAKELQLVLAEIYRSLRSGGLSAEDAKARIAVMEPFDRYPEHVASLDGEL